MIIDKPGIYRGISAVDYHADPCPEPSLTQSLAKILIEHSPRHALTMHPRLNADFEPEDDKKFDLGSAAHRIMLGRGRELAVIECADWRTKASKELRDQAVANGFTPILQHQFEQAVQITDAATHQLDKHEDRDAFTRGDPEVMLAWQEDGIWFRALVDWLHDDLLTVDDYKTSGMSMAPHVLGYRAEAAGWHIQAAFIERGLDVLYSDNRGRRKFRFIAQETDKPYGLTVMHMDEHWLTMGRKQVDTAVSIWKTCIRTNQWPGYTARSIVPVFPGYKEARWLERELSGEFDSENDSSVTMAG
jgi:PDDEXK-like domain of unknown function (DUF3799)